MLAPIITNRQPRHFLLLNNINLRAQIEIALLGKKRRRKNPTQKQIDRNREKKIKKSIAHKNEIVQLNFACFFISLDFFSCSSVLFSFLFFYKQILNWKLINVCSAASKMITKFVVLKTRMVFPIWFPRYKKCFYTSTNGNRYILYKSVICILYTHIIYNAKYICTIHSRCTRNMHLCSYYTYFVIIFFFCHDIHSLMIFTLTSFGLLSKHNPFPIRNASI